MEVKSFPSIRSLQKVVSYQQFYRETIPSISKLVNPGQNSLPSHSKLIVIRYPSYLIVSLCALPITFISTDVPYLRTYPIYLRAYLPIGNAHHCHPAPNRAPSIRVRVHTHTRTHSLVLRMHTRTNALTHARTYAFSTFSAFSVRLHTHARMQLKLGESDAKIVCYCYCCCY